MADDVFELFDDYAVRRARGVKRPQIVEALVERLGLDPRKREKVAGYVHRAETRLVDPKGVDPRVWEVWSDVVGAREAELVGLQPSPRGPRPRRCSGSPTRRRSTACSPAPRRPRSTTRSTSSSPAVDNRTSDRS